MKKDKNNIQNSTKKPKDRATRIPLKPKDAPERYACFCIRKRYLSLVQKQ